MRTHHLLAPNPVRLIRERNNDPGDHELAHIRHDLQPHAMIVLQPLREHDIRAQDSTVLRPSPKSICMRLLLRPASKGDYTDYRRRQKDLFNHGVHPFAEPSERLLDRPGVPRRDEAPVVPQLRRGEVPHAHLARVPFLPSSFWVVN